MNPKEKELEINQSSEIPLEDANVIELIKTKQIEDDFEYREYYSTDIPSFDVD